MLSTNYRKIFLLLCLAFLSACSTDQYRNLSSEAAFETVNAVEFASAKEIYSHDSIADESSALSTQLNGLNSEISKITILQAERLIKSSPKISAHDFEKNLNFTREAYFSKNSQTSRFVFNTGRNLIIGTPALIATPMIAAAAGAALETSLPTFESYYQKVPEVNSTGFQAYERIYRVLNALKTDPDKADILFQTLRKDGIVRIKVPVPGYDELIVKGAVPTLPSEHRASLYQEAADKIIESMVETRRRLIPDLTQDSKAERSRSSKVSMAISAFKDSELTAVTSSLISTASSLAPFLPREAQQKVLMVTQLNRNIAQGFELKKRFDSELKTIENIQAFSTLEKTQLRSLARLRFSADMISMGFSVANLFIKSPSSDLLILQEVAALRQEVRDMHKDLADRVDNISRKIDRMWNDLKNTLESIESQNTLRLSEMTALMKKNYAAVQNLDQRFTQEIHDKWNTDLRAYLGNIERAKSTDDKVRELEQYIYTFLNSQSGNVIGNDLVAWDSNRILEEATKTYKDPITLDTYNAYFLNIANGASIDKKPEFEFFENRVSNLRKWKTGVQLIIPYLSSEEINKSSRKKTLIDAALLPYTQHQKAMLASFCSGDEKQCSHHAREKFKKNLAAYTRESHQVQTLAAKEFDTITSRVSASVFKKVLSRDDYRKFYKDFNLESIEHSPETPNCSSLEVGHSGKVHGSASGTLQAGNGVIREIMKDAKSIEVSTYREILGKPLAMLVALGLIEAQECLRLYFVDRNPVGGAFHAGEFRYYIYLKTKTDHPLYASLEASLKAFDGMQWYDWTFIADTKHTSLAPYVQAGLDMPHAAWNGTVQSHFTATFNRDQLNSRIAPHLPSLNKIVEQYYTAYDEALKSNWAHVFQKQEIQNGLRTMSAYKALMATVASHSFATLYSSDTLIRSILEGQLLLDVANQDSWLAELSDSGSFYSQLNTTFNQGPELAQSYFESISDWTLIPKEEYFRTGEVLKTLSHK